MLRPIKSPQKKTPDNAVKIHLPKRLDMLAAPFLYEDLENMVWQGRCLVLDFSKTQFIDPTGLSVLKEGFIKCKNKSTRLILLGVKPHIKAILEAAQLFDLLKQKPGERLRRDRLSTPRRFQPIRQHAS